MFFSLKSSVLLFPFNHSGISHPIYPLRIFHIVLIDASLAKFIFSITFWGSKGTLFFVVVSSYLSHITIKSLMKRVFQLA